MRRLAQGDTETLQNRPYSNSIDNAIKANDHVAYIVGKTSTVYDTYDLIW